MTCFTSDNTEGYSAADLACLNATYEFRLHDLRDQGVDVDAEDAKSLRDHVAERVLADFDSAAGEG